MPWEWPHPVPPAWIPPPRRDHRTQEERLNVAKHPVETGEVRVHKEVPTENKTIEVPVEREEVVIERTPSMARASTEGMREGEEASDSRA